MSESNNNLSSKQNECKSSISILWIKNYSLREGKEAEDTNTVLFNYLISQFNKAKYLLLISIFCCGFEILYFWHFSNLLFNTYTAILYDMSIIFFTIVNILICFGYSGKFYYLGRNFLEAEDTMEKLEIIHKVLGFNYIIKYILYTGFLLEVTNFFILAGMVIVQI